MMLSHTLNCINVQWLWYLNRTSLTMNGITRFLLIGFVLLLAIQISFAGKRIAHIACMALALLCLFLCSKPHVDLSYTFITRLAIKDYR